MDFNRLKSKIVRMITIHPLVSYSGEYRDFEEAEKYCEGYDKKEIFDKVKVSTLAVKNGEARYERDAVLFYDKQINHKLFVYLFRIALENQGKLIVLDWGGSLGSVYFQHKDFIKEAKVDCKWIITEQEHFVAFGKNELEDAILQFTFLPTCKEEIPECHCVLLSSVLQYIPDYYQVIDMLINKEVPYMILERTPLGNRERIWIEKVTEPIYNASYPCRMICEDELLTYITDRGYEIVDTWNSDMDVDIYLQKDHAVFKSYVFKRMNE